MRELRVPFAIGGEHLIVLWSLCMACLDSFSAAARVLLTKVLACETWNTSYPPLQSSVYT